MCLVRRAAEYVPEEVPELGGERKRLGQRGHHLRGNMSQQCGVYDLQKIVEGENMRIMTQKMRLSQIDRSSTQ